MKTHLKCEVFVILCLDRECESGLDRERFDRELHRLRAFARSVNAIGPIASCFSFAMDENSFLRRLEEVEIPVCCN